MENNNFESYDSREIPVSQSSPVFFSATNSNGGTFPESNHEDESRNPAFHFFLYIIVFVSLTFIATGLVAILYQIIEKFFVAGTQFIVQNSNYQIDPPVRSYSLFDQNTVKFGLASIVIATPVFLFVSFLIHKFLFEGKIKKDSRVRKWTTYVALFVALVTMLTNLVYLVFALLTEVSSLASVLKIFSVFLIAGGIFAYYFWDIRKKETEGIKYVKEKIFGWFFLATILFVFVFSLFIIDNPVEIKNKEDDAMLISKLDTIPQNIEAYFSQKGVLPANLKEINSSGNSASPYIDGTMISYEKIGQYSYKLCAAFKSSNLKDVSANDWQHDKGVKCFNREVTPDANITNNYNPATVPTSVPVPVVSQHVQYDTQQYDTRVYGPKLDNVRWELITAAGSARACRREVDGTVGTVKGGQGNRDVICVGGYMGAVWSTISACGPNPEDSIWKVSNGDSDAWSLTLTCREFQDCNGPDNAICNKDGCKFAGTCQ